MPYARWCTPSPQIGGVSSLALILVELFVSLHYIHIATLPRGPAAVRFLILLLIFVSLDDQPEKVPDGDALLDRYTQGIIRRLGGFKTLPPRSIKQQPTDVALAHPDMQDWWVDIRFLVRHTEGREP